MGGKGNRKGTEREKEEEKTDTEEKVRRKQKKKGGRGQHPPPHLLIFLPSDRALRSPSLFSIKSSAQARRRS
jgi:hypothetical protein